jgi:hypothetical protein
MCISLYIHIMDNSKINIQEIIKKLIEDLGEFTSDAHIAAIVSRIVGHKVHGCTIKRLREVKRGGQLMKSVKKAACLDKYDHRKIREFLDNWKKENENKA